MNILMFKHRPIIYLLSAALCSVLSLTSCTDDNPDVKPGEKQITFSTMQGDVWLNSQSDNASRAGSLSSYPISSIGIHSYANASGSLTIFDNEQALTVDNGANYTIATTAYWNPLLYKFFAYSPYQSTSVVTEGSSYSSFASFIWRNLPAFSSEDYMVGTEIVLRNNTSMTNTGAVQFSMRHIFARIRFLFKIGTDYDDMREIRIKKVEVLQAGAIRSIDLKYTPSATEPLTWTNTVNGVSEPVELKRATPGNAELILEDGGTTFAPYGSVYVYPQALASIRFRVTYDVYDTANYDTEQICVRPDETIETTIYPTWGTLRAGNYYDLKINVEPRFIYTITDTDQCDGYIVIK